MYAREVESTVSQDRHTLSSITSALNNNAVHIEDMIEQLGNLLNPLIIHGPVGPSDVAVCTENSPAVNQLCEVNCKLIDLKEKIAYLLDRVQV